MNNGNNNIGNKSNKLINIVLILLIVIILIINLLVFIEANKKNNIGKDNNIEELENNNSNVNNEIENNSNDNKEENNDIVEVSDINVGDNSLSNFRKLYLDKEKVYVSSFNIKNITKKELIGTAVNNIDKSLIGFSGQTKEEATYITVDELNRVLDNVIFNHDIISIEDIKSLCVTSSSELCGDKIIEVDDNKIKVYNYPHGMSHNIEVIDKIKKVEKSSEYLYVYSNIAFRLFELTEVDRMTYKYYSDYKTNNFIEQIFSESSIEPNWNLYDTYKYTFKIDNSNYYFEKIELVD